ncbi:uncharacterized protein BP5553_06297 [Venustampulla echinocandica]|uniref:Uncharacterized protein n=1 Tax=Venustampulla echinocandica TaxID=2656787 RepID=A0A370TJJ4_9HELO|nr:uncharacterized protein BP5553_06297 [Venustampulla echinocandica]RDL35685.1 hypothetical protein BP5553_06297 [Venustampulla echinocandica]
MTDRSAPRLYPCYLLQDNKIPSVVWFEDALGHHGVSTVVFNLYLLVDDIEAAAQVLVRDGWSIVAFDSSQFDIGFSAKAHRRLLPPQTLNENDPTKASTHFTGPPPPPAPPTNRPASATTTILLPAEEWNYKLPPSTDVVTSYYPPLPDLLDALIDSFLDCTPGMLFAHLACQVGYLYQYVSALKSPSFSDQLKYDHRQFHLDSLSGMSTGTVPFAKHQRAIREALREGNYTLQTCSASRDNTYLFNQAEQKRLHTAMRQRDFSS